MEERIPASFLTVEMWSLQITAPQKPTVVRQITMHGECYRVLLRAEVAHTGWSALVDLTVTPSRTTSTAALSVLRVLLHTKTAQ